MGVGFALADANVDAHQRCRGYLLDTTVAQATVWMADDVQYELTGYEFVEWLIADQQILLARVVEDQAAWVDPHTDTVIALIGELCQAPDTVPTTGGVGQLVHGDGVDEFARS